MKTLKTQKTLLHKASNSSFSIKYNNISSNSTSISSTKKLPKANIGDPSNSCYFSFISEKYLLNRFRIPQKKS